MTALGCITEGEGEVSGKKRGYSVEVILIRAAPHMQLCDGR